MSFDATLADVRMCDWPILVSIEAFLAVVAVTTSSVMTALDADASAFSTRHQIELLVESAAARMTVTLAR